MKSESFIFMQYAHNIKIKVFSKEKDDPEELKISLLTLLPYEEEELEKEKIILNEEKILYEGGREMIIFSIFLDKQRHIRKFLTHLNELLDWEQKDFLLKTIDLRLDDNMNFFFRIDKTKFNSGELYFTESGSCFHFKINIAAYPAKIENAKKIVEEIFK